MTSENHSSQSLVAFRPKSGFLSRLRQQQAICSILRLVSFAWLCGTGRPGRVVEESLLLEVVPACDFFK